MNSENTSRSFLTIKDVMRLLSVSRRTIYHWINKGILNPSRIGGVYRFHPEDIENLVRKNRTTPVERKIAILAIDDDLLVRESLKILFGRAGFEATVVSNGKQALEAVENQTFDLIITDVRMPEMDGMQTLKAIRESCKKLGKKPVPEIVMTAYEDTGAKKEADRTGVKAFIMKPFEWADFMAAIHSAVR